LITTPATAEAFGTVPARGPVSRQEIARVTGPSSAAITKAARPFLDQGCRGAAAGAVRSLVTLPPGELSR
jgi:biotin operon repressor